MVAALKEMGDSDEPLKGIPQDGAIPEPMKKQLYDSVTKLTRVSQTVRSLEIDPSEWIYEKHIEVVW
jgi:hypothetical protein